MSVLAFVEPPAVVVVGVVTGHGLSVAEHALPILLAVLLSFVVVPSLVQYRQFLPLAAPLARFLRTVF